MSPKIKESSRFRLNTDLVVACTAVIISVCALVVAVFQVQIESKQLKATVWPRLGIDISRARSTPYHYLLTVNNKGVGPAIISNVEIRYKGKQYEYLFDAIYDMMPDSIRQIEKINYVSTGGFFNQDVMKAGDTQIIMKFPDSQPLVNWMCSKEDSLFANPDFIFRIGYQDIYGNAWVMDKFTVIETDSPQ